MNDADVWSTCNLNHLWLFDKCILSKYLGYTCGPVGVDVPRPNSYIVRPCVNLLGMSIGAEILFLEKNTDHLPAGYFWCEVFEGDHFSVDFQNGKQFLAVQGFREKESPLWKFSKWKKVDLKFSFPEFLAPLCVYYDTINIEMIGNKIIEVHFRNNPDFVYNNSIAIPVWKEEEINVPSGMRFVSSIDYKRKGFYVDDVS